MFELGAWLELVATDGLVRVGRIGNCLLERFQIRTEASIADPAQMIGCLGLVGHS